MPAIKRGGKIDFCWRILIFLIIMDAGKISDGESVVVHVLTSLYLDSRVMDLKNSCVHIISP